jgi:hypothetical protein
MRSSVNLGRKATAPARASRQAVVVKAAFEPRDLLSKGAAIATAGDWGLDLVDNNSLGGS